MKGHLVRGATWAVAAVLLAAAMWFYARKPHAESGELDPVRTDGRIGRVVTNRSFSLEVGKVEVAGSLSTGSTFSGVRELRTDGVFVIVRLRAAAARKPVQLGAPELHSPGGYVFRASPRTAVFVNFESSVEPLVWTPSAALFEVPRARLAGARLVVGEGGLLTQLSAQTSVDLGISRQKAADLIAHAARRYDPRAVRP